MGFTPAAAGTSKAGKIAGEEVLPTRLFEGAAGGAIILGTAPRCPEFHQCFDWPDAVIEIAPQGEDIVALIDQLDAQHQRIERARQTNSVRCLLQHDWVYRWEHILSSVEMEALPQLRQRKLRLSEIAATAVSAAAA